MCAASSGADKLRAEIVTIDDRADPRSGRSVAASFRNQRGRSARAARSSMHLAASAGDWRARAVTGPRVSECPFFRANEGGPVGEVRAPSPWGLRGAGGGSRTPDLRFTKPLLYQLSYAGNGRHFSPAARRFALPFAHKCTTSPRIAIVQTMTELEGRSVTTRARARPHSSRSRAGSRYRAGAFPRSGRSQPPARSGW